jgi:tetratricopeptide (TPR) repeat protein
MAPRSKVLEYLMRLSPPAVAFAAILLSVSSTGHGQRADADVLPLSQTLTAEGNALLAAQKLDEATNALESALAVDPRNRAAFMALARVAEKQDLPGKAIRLYREALLIEPNDVEALSGQGEALVQRGALTKAQENLARIKQLCVAACPEQEKLAAVIARGVPVKTLSAQAVQPKPVISETPKAQ